jgi:hypothetical protein
MLVTRRERPIVVFNVLYVVCFSVIALGRHNYEFVLYTGVVIALAAWILLKQRTVQFDLVILWGLSLWGLLHMAGGNIRVGGGVLYSVHLVPVYLRYDQFVHAFGFGTATLVCYHLLCPYLRPTIERRRMLMVLVVLMGCGVGALNEIVEFIAVKTVPETNVGGYDNTLWDLVFNLIGATIAAAWISRRRSFASKAAALSPPDSYKPRE